MSNAEDRDETVVKRAANAKAKAIAAAPSPARAGAISCKASLDKPPPSAGSSARATETFRGAPARSGSPSVSISAMAFRKCAILSALPLGDMLCIILCVHYLFNSDRKPERVKEIGLAYPRAATGRAERLRFRRWSAH